MAPASRGRRGPAGACAAATAASPAGARLQGSGRALGHPRAPSPGTRSPARCRRSPAGRRRVGEGGGMEARAALGMARRRRQAARARLRGPQCHALPMPVSRRMRACPQPPPHRQEDQQGAAVRVIELCRVQQPHLLRRTHAHAETHTHTHTRTHTKRTRVRAQVAAGRAGAFDRVQPVARAAACLPRVPVRALRACAIHRARMGVQHQPPDGCSKRRRPAQRGGAHGAIAAVCPLAHRCPLAPP
jgi:hypothetical protein